MTICKESIRTEERPGPSRSGAYVVQDIMDNGRIVGKIIFAYPKDGAGILYASMWDWSNKNSASRDIQCGRATGYGYDKKSTCVDGMKFGSGDREFILDCPGNGFSVAESQFRAHGYEVFGVL